MTAALVAVAVCAYAFAASRRSRWPLRRSVSFAAGLVVLALAQIPAGLGGHVTEHVLIALVAAPLLVLGQPHALFPRRVPAPLRALAAWPVTWLLFAATTLVVHLNEPPTATLAHALEHAVVLTTAVLFWFPVLAAPPAPRPLAPIARVAYLFAAMVPMGVVGALLESTRVYEHYSQAAQADAGSLMWVASSIVLVVATVLAAWSAMVTEERRQRAREKYEAVR